jgi:elongation factor 1-beta
MPSPIPIVLPVLPSVDLTARSSSYAPSQADVAIFKAIGNAPLLNVARWYYHIKSFESEFANLPGSSTAGEAFLGGSGAAPAKAADAPAKADDDDDEIDLFGSDDEVDEEQERIKAERVAAYNAKKADKPKTAAKVRALSITRDNSS